MFITCLDFKINDKIVALRFPLISENNILIPYYMSNNLEELSLILDFNNQLEIDNGWFIIPLNRPKKEVLDLIKVFDSLDEGTINVLKEYFNNKLIGVYYIDLDKTVIFIFKKFYEGLFKKLQLYLGLKNEDIYTILKMKEAQEDINLPYVVYHTNKNTLILGNFSNFVYFSIKFDEISEYLSFISKLIEEKKKLKK